MGDSNIYEWPYFGRRNAVQLGFVPSSSTLQRASQNKRFLSTANSLHDDWSKKEIWAVKVDTRLFTVSAIDSSVGGRLCWKSLRLEWKSFNQWVSGITKLVRSPQTVSLLRFDKVAMKSGRDFFIKLVLISFDCLTSENIKLNLYKGPGQKKPYMWIVMNWICDELISFKTMFTNLFLPFVTF